MYFTTSFKLEENKCLSFKSWLFEDFLLLEAATMLNKTFYDQEEGIECMCYLLQWWVNEKSFQWKINCDLHIDHSNHKFISKI